MEREQIKSIIKDIILEMNGSSIPVGVSNRHVHLCEADMEILFPNSVLKMRKELKQKGEFASEQVVVLKGPKNEIKNVRVLGPLRTFSQVEVSLTDARLLGVKPPIAMSGDLKDAVPITISSDYGTITKSVCIVAKRHIHMNLDDARKYRVSDGDCVSVELNTNDRRTIFDDVIIRISPNYVLEMHIDTDEANAVNATDDMVAYIVK